MSTYRYQKTHTRMSTCSQHYSPQPNTGNHLNVPNNKSWYIHPAEYLLYSNENKQTAYNTKDQSHHQFWQKEAWPQKVYSVWSEVKALVNQSCSYLLATLWTSSSPGSFMHAITLEWVAIPFSGDLPSQGLNPHCRQIPYCLHHQGSPHVVSPYI